LSIKRLENNAFLSAMLAYDMGEQQSNQEIPNEKTKVVLLFLLLDRIECTIIFIRSIKIYFAFVNPKRTY